MNKKKKALIAAGGTGGHVFPGCNLAAHLRNRDYRVHLVTDKRGFLFLRKFNNLNVSILPSSPIASKNILTIILSIVIIFYAVLRSIIFLIFNRPTIIIGMGGYASFPLCIAASILNIKFVIYENNLIIGKANKLLLPFCKKILVSYKELEGINERYKNKIIQVGNIIRKEIIQFKDKNVNNLEINKFSILVLGGSQAARVFAEVLPNIFYECTEEKIPLKIYQHCLPSQNEKLKSFYEEKKIEFETFNFSNDLIEFFSKINLAITRSGSSIQAELTNANIPFISVPLPSSADNHQHKNALYYQRKNYAFLLEEKDLNNKLLSYIKEFYDNKSILNKIAKNQRNHSDKNVYNIIDRTIEEITNEKN